MMNETTVGQPEAARSEAAEPRPARAPYTAPRLVNLGSVESLTHGPGTGEFDGAGSQPA